MNIVEMIANPDGCKFDQPCRFGHRVEGHAVYCHNNAWADSPRKCKRTWYTGGEIRDEDCPGYQPNENYGGAHYSPNVLGERCTRCGGAKVLPADRGTLETCDRCMGDGAEPKAMRLTGYGQDTLELGCEHTGRYPGRGERYIRIAENDTEVQMVLKLNELALILIHSMSFTRSGARVFCISLTPKGDAVMQANWEENKV